MIVEAASLLFAQHRATTWELFAPDWLDVPVERFPHSRYLGGDAGWFRRYLRASWRKTDVRAGVARIERMRTGSLSGPITLCRRGDQWLVVDGNHRAAIWAFRGEAIEAEEITAQSYAEQVVANPTTRWGSKPGRPYQTVDLPGIAIAGRRTLADRHALIRAEDLEDRTVLDLGCNLGMSSHFAYEAGARAVEGWEHDWGVATSAVRLAVLTGRPITFRHADVTAEEPVARDTCFAFAVHEHADVTRAISLSGVVYLETHRDAAPPSELSAGRTSELLGHTDGGRRRLYRLARV